MCIHSGSASCYFHTECANSKRKRNVQSCWKDAFTLLTGMQIWEGVLWLILKCHIIFFNQIIVKIEDVSHGNETGLLLVNSERIIDLFFYQKKNFLVISWQLYKNVLLYFIIVLRDFPLHFSKQKYVFKKNCNKK